jgi:hypothetical protein
LRVARVLLSVKDLLKKERQMPTMSHTPAVAAALTAACDALLAMIENDHGLFPTGEYLMIALLSEASGKDLCNAAVLRRQYARLAFLKCIVQGVAQAAASRGPRCG